MKLANILLLIVILGIIGVIVADRQYVSKFQEKFRVLEKQRIVTSNKLATAKIIHENLHHVRDLVFKNMDFPGQKDTIHHESHLFDFITTCVNDLKLKLVSVKPERPATQDRVTTYTYNINVDGDFFKFGELCAKFENSRRIVSLESFKVSLVDKSEKRSGGAEKKAIHVEMTIDTYRVKKAPEIDTTANSEELTKS